MIAFVVGLIIVLGSVAGLLIASAPLIVELYDHRRARELETDEPLPWVDPPIVKEQKKQYYADIEHDDTYGPPILPVGEYAEHCGRCERKVQLRKEHEQMRIEQQELEDQDRQKSEETLLREIKDLAVRAGQYERAIGLAFSEDSREVYRHNYDVMRREIERRERLLDELQRQ